MKEIDHNSPEFTNFKDVVSRNKLKSSGTPIDTIVDILKQNNIHLNKETT